jgi:uncharacterized damage-inducible protein DinB
MTETSRIADQLRHAFDGDAWHGPAVLELLSRMDAATAAAHPIPNAHSIWELVLHTAAWDGAVNRRIVGGKAVKLNAAQNFPPVKDKSAAAWQKALEHLKKSHDELLTTVSTMSDERLSEQVPGKKYDIYFMLHGVVQHELYHAGQIAVLKKAHVKKGTRKRAS